MPETELSEGRSSSSDDIETSPASSTSAKCRIALCLSGGGYRAMVFHLGALMRLNETGYLQRLTCVSSVSGGSITAGYLGLKWNNLKPNSGVATELGREVIDPILNLASTTIDRGAVIGGLLLPGSISDRVTKAYEKWLFGASTLQDLPDPSYAPLFVINATNVQTGKRWHFSKERMGDWTVGYVQNPSTRLSVAVAASSAFPPVLSPLRLKLQHADFSSPKLKPPFTTDVVLSDGGVYDNLGLEYALRNSDVVLVSDAGGEMSQERSPKADWARHSYRALQIVDNQVRSLRKRHLVGDFQTKKRMGTYWGIRTDITNYGLPNALPCPMTNTLELAETPTRLKRLEPEHQNRLMNWGYAVCDAALRAHINTALPPPAGFPRPGGV